MNTLIRLKITMLTRDQKPFNITHLSAKDKTFLGVTSQAVLFDLVRVIPLHTLSEMKMGFCPGPEYNIPIPHVPVSLSLSTPATTEQLTALKETFDAKSVYEIETPGHIEVRFIY